MKRILDIGHMDLRLFLKHKSAYVWLFVVPLAFVSYFPSLYLLGRPDGLGLPPFFAFLSPAVAVIFLVVARGIWRFGVNHYQSTGS